MRKIQVLFLFMAVALTAMSQKKPLDHSVYDGWKSLGERQISNNGQYAVYSINPQEGDGMLVIQSLENTYKKEVPRGYGAYISPDSRFVVFRIRPLFKDTRDARIKKKRPDDMPKDTLAIVELGKDSVLKIARVKSFKTPAKGEGNWIAYLNEKSLPEAPKPRVAPDSATQVNNLAKMADSLIRVADSLRAKALEAKTKGISVLAPAKKDRPAAPKTPEDPFEEGTELVLRNLKTAEEKKYKLVTDYLFDEQGSTLLIETSKKTGDSTIQASVVLINTSDFKADTIFKKFNDAKNYAFDDAGKQVVFVAERDSAAKALQKFYKLIYFEKGMKEAVVKADRSTTGVRNGFTVSPDFNNQFSKDGSKLYFGWANIRKPKDTTLVDFETARLDVWHYNDDNLQPQQLLQVQADLRRSQLAVFNKGTASFVWLENSDDDFVQTVNQGNADYVLAATSKGYRIADQWQGFSKMSAYIVSTKDGSRKKVADTIRGQYSASPSGKYVFWYNWLNKTYFAYNVQTGKTAAISKGVKVPIWDEEDDHPDDPPPHGVAGWLANDEVVYIYDKYDIWGLDPEGIKPPVNITMGVGRKNKMELRYNRTNPEERFLENGQELLLRAFNTGDKKSSIYTLKLGANAQPFEKFMQEVSVMTVTKAKNATTYLVQKSTIKSAELYASKELAGFSQLTNIASQQESYNWLTAELIKWKMFDGKEAEGLVFKPENFDPKKKYPVIYYFYERDADGLYNYRAPAPSASTVNIPYFVSNGYIVVDPNIYYKNGEPGESAFNSVVSCAKYMAKLPYVDSTKMAIQGQSWGGYQVAYLVTRTKMFAAAGAGAPVANMTSAYGGIRWGSGLNRQFQYERTQSRIGATLWQRRDLYLKNSPLFAADKVTTPLLIMHNDKDGAVPWYQGIEYFTALRRLNKKVWLLQYNDEDHNLVERRNRKDLSVRLGQFFDYHLKGAKPAKWLTDGVPAIDKGIDWGLEINE